MGTIEALQKARQFLHDFNLSSQSEFKEICKFQSGFSVLRKYPENGVFFPPKLADSSDDSFALIFIVADPAELRDTKLIPLNTKATIYPKYLRDHPEYNYSDPHSPTKESVDRSNSTPKPQTIETSEKYFYDSVENLIKDRSGTTVSLNSILEQMYTAHLATLTVGRRTARKYLNAFAEKRLTVAISILMWVAFLLGYIDSRQRRDPDHTVLIYRTLGNSGPFGNITAENIPPPKAKKTLLGIEGSTQAIYLFAFSVLLGGIVYFFSPRIKTFFSLGVIQELKPYKEKAAGLLGNNLFVVSTSLVAIGILTMVLEKVGKLTLVIASELTRKRYLLRYRIKEI